MKEHTGRVTIHGNPLTLLGDLPEVGRPAPPFQVLDNDLKPFSSASLAGKLAVIASVPSLDTPVCDMETRRFNTEATALGQAVTVLTVSMDLPFAQKRWCAAAGVDRVVTLSDHREADFGRGYGVLIKELRLLARAVFVVDPKGVVRYVQLVAEVAGEPDYAALLGAVKALL